MYKPIIISGHTFVPILSRIVSLYKGDLLLQSMADGSHNIHEVIRMSAYYVCCVGGILINIECLVKYGYKVSYKSKVHQGIQKTKSMNKLMIIQHKMLIDTLRIQLATLEEFERMEEKSEDENTQQSILLHTYIDTVQTLMHMTPDKFK